MLFKVVFFYHVNGTLFRCEQNVDTLRTIFTVPDYYINIHVLRFTAFIGCLLQSDEKENKNYCRARSTLLKIVHKNYFRTHTTLSKLVLNVRVTIQMFRFYLLTVIQAKFNIPGCSFCFEYQI